MTTEELLASAFAVNFFWLGLAMKSIFRWVAKRGITSEQRYLLTRLYQRKRHLREKAKQHKQTPTCQVNSGSCGISVVLHSNPDQPDLELNWLHQQCMDHDISNWRINTMLD